MTISQIQLKLRYSDPHIHHLENFPRILSGPSPRLLK